MTSLIRKIGLTGILAASLAASQGQASGGPADLHGSAMPAGSQADRTITVTPRTKSVNVQHGETVKFVVPSEGASQEIVWKFDGAANRLSLSDVLRNPSASAGASAGNVTGADIPIFVNQSTNPLSNPGD